MNIHYEENNRYLLHIKLIYMDNGQFNTRRWDLWVFYLILPVIICSIYKINKTAILILRSEINSVMRMDM